MATTANQNPANVVHRKVTFNTTNLSNGDIFDEPYFVNGPTPGGTFNIPLNGVGIVGNKVVVPIQTTTGWGSYWLKFWLPQPGSKIMYVTFAQKNASMADGYYDYITGVPSDYRTALRTWIRDNVATPINSSVTKTKSLVFTSYGLDTNQVSAAIQFKINFTAIFAGNTGTSVDLARTTSTTARAVL